MLGPFSSFGHRHLTYANQQDPRGVNQGRNRRSETRVTAKGRTGITKPMVTRLFKSLMDTVTEMPRKMER